MWWWEKLGSRVSKPENKYTTVYNLYNKVFPVAKKRLIYPVDMTNAKTELDIITKKLGIPKAEAVRDAVRHYAEYLGGLEVVTYREIPRKKARQEIKTYLKGKNRVWASEISDNLRIDFTTVNEILIELWQEGTLEPE